MKVEWQVGRRVFSEVSMATLDTPSDRRQDQSTPALAVAA